MGWYINYEIEINGNIDWDDEKVKNKLANYNCLWLYLRDMDEAIVVMTVYTQDNILYILDELKTLYNVKIRYRYYRFTDVGEWTDFGI